MVIDHQKFKVAPALRQDRIDRLTDKAEFLDVSFRNHRRSHGLLPVQRHAARGGRVEALQQRDEVAHAVGDMAAAQRRAADVGDVVADALQLVEIVTEDLDHAPLLQNAPAQRVFRHEAHDQNRLCIGYRLPLVCRRVGESKSGN